MMRSILVGVAVVALAAGCGGGKRLSRAEFSKQADAICSKYNAKIRALGQPGSVRALPRYVDRALPIARKGTEELRRLKPPKDDEKTASEWLDQNDSAVGALERLRDAARHADRAGIQAALSEAAAANRAANRFARQLGLRVCARG
jgi:transcriptional regulator with GAF, ATPase, and Fis domain